MTTIDCAGFERWLDDGADAALAAGMHAHAAGCAGCAAALAAMAEIDAALAAAPAAPAGFTDAVMARVEHVSRAPARAPAVADDMPWWVAILQQPAVVLASLLAALVLWRADLLLAATVAAAAWISEAGRAIGALAAARLGDLAPAASTTTAATAWDTGHLMVTALALGLAPVLVYGSMALAGWVTRSVTRRVLAA
jgi:hypothetical protein